MESTGFPENPRETNIIFFGISNRRTLSYLVGPIITDYAPASERCLKRVELIKSQSLPGSDNNYKTNCLRTWALSIRTRPKALRVTQSSCEVSKKFRTFEQL